MNEIIKIRLFAGSDAEAVQNIIHRGLREVNGKGIGCSHQGLGKR